MTTLEQLRRERDPDLAKLERERAAPMPSELKLPRGFGELVTGPIEETMASLAARRHILELGRRKR
jgi:hypothetical protein